jgi:serine/threonine protein kinase
MAWLGEWIVATGKPPWSEYSNNLAALFHVATTSEPPPVPNHLSPESSAFIRSCLVIEPDKRTSAQDLLTQSAFLRPELDRALSVHNTPLSSNRKKASFPPLLSRASTGATSTSNTSSATDSRDRIRSNSQADASKVS